MELEAENNITALYIVVLCMSRTESLRSAALLQTFAPAAQLSMRSASNAEVAGEIPAGSANQWACGSTRIAEGPDSESGSLGGASPFMPTISRRLASAGIADPSDLKSPSLPGASPGSPTGVWLTGNSRPVRLKIEQPWECKSPHADQFGMSTGQASRTCLLNSGLPERGVWCESTAFRHSCARSSKRAVRYAELGVTAVVPSDG